MDRDLTAQELKKKRTKGIIITAICVLGIATAFLLFRQSHQDHVGVVFGHSNQMDQPGLGQRRQQANAARRERLVNQS